MLVTLLPKRAPATKANAASRQHAQRAIVFRSALVRVERAVSGNLDRQRHPLTMERSSREGSVLFVVETLFAPFSNDPVASHAEMEPSLSPSKPVHAWQKRHASRLLSHPVQISADQRKVPSGCGVKAEPVNPPVHERVAHCGGPEITGVAGETA
jgi:hypothetical protein